MWSKAFVVGNTQMTRTTGNLSVSYKKINTVSLGTKPVIGMKVCDQY